MASAEAKTRLAGAAVPLAALVVGLFLAQPRILTDPRNPGLFSQTGKLLLNTEVPSHCKTLFDSANLAATDDVPDLWIFRDATTIVAAKGISTGGTSVTVTIEDDAGNDLTTSCVLTTSLTNCTLTANDSFTADERADWTTVSVSGSVTSATMCLYADVD